MKTEGDLTSCAVQRQMCVDFVRSAGRPAYRLLDERFEDIGESGVELRIAAMPELAGGAFARYARTLLLWKKCRRGRIATYSGAFGGDQPSCDMGTLPQMKLQETKRLVQ